MCGGGTNTTQQTVQIPPDVLARYNSVNQRAEDVAGTPFHQYSTDPNAFVAPLSDTQRAGVAGTNAGAGIAQPYYDAATGRLINAQDSAQPYYDAASGRFIYAGSASQPYFNAAGTNIDNAEAFGGAGASQALHSLQKAGLAAAPLTTAAAQNISGGLAAAQPYNAVAAQQFGQGLGAAQPLNDAANENITRAQAGAQPYQATATGLGLAGARSINPDDLGASQISKYLSPYLGSVLSSTQALLNQDNQRAQSSQLGDAVKSGAFGGDRSGIAAAALARQQQLGNASIYSGILNQGYGQALSAAQQQQGLGLSAEQANRAAQAAASGQLAAIGQQGFGQGITTAQQQAALGQQKFGQGLGAGQAFQGLGNQVYGQQTGTGQAQAGLGGQLFGQGLQTAQEQAAVGQQMFGQQLAAAQARAGLGGQLFSQANQTGLNLQGLGQQVYGTGAATSQGLAGLGAGAQGAALQGAQAQLAAGQVQQQTSQAGLTALYNQFLQQQSYPFQVAQFLANIAEGTGALSGSTTTTTQPAGIFSDERLKTAIEPVGETYDGQKVVRYRYKGDPKWRMGLIAQDVEKKHPDAVGSAAGYRTVDYRKATDAAATRGHFAEGGVAGFDPAIMQQILANAAGMYGPYVTSLGGPYGGGLGRVPSANLPVAQLKTAGPAPQMHSALENAKQIADLGTELSKDADQAKDGWDWVSRKMGPHEDPPYARGGLAGYADGGMPYSTQAGGLDIPDDKPALDKLPTPGQPPKTRSDMDDAKTATDIALTVAKIAAMMQRGGSVRGGYADGGSPDDLAGNVVDFNAASDGGGGSTRHFGPFYTSPKPTVVSSAPAAPFGRMETDSNGDHVWNAWGPKRPPDIHPTLGGVLSIMNPAAGAIGLAARVADGVGAATRQSVDHPRAAAAAAPHPAAHHVARRATGLAPPPANDAQPSGLQPAPTEEVAGAPDVVPMTRSDPGALSNTPSQAPGLGAALQAPGSDDHLGLLRRLKDSPPGHYVSELGHGDLPAWVGLLSGIGTMGSVPTRNLGTALAAGLVGGTRGYMGARGAEANIAKTRADVGLTQAQTYQQMQAKAPAGYVAVAGAGPRGEHFVGFDGKPWHYQMQVNATDFGAPSSPSTPAAKVSSPDLGPFVSPSAGTDAYMRDHFKIDPSQPGVANHERAVALNPELVPLDDAARESLKTRIGNLQDVDNQHRQLLQLSEAINGLSHSSLTGQGHGSEYRARLANIYSTAANLLGVPVDPGVTKDIGENQIISKIKELSGVAIAHQNNERAASIAKTISGVLPGGDLQPAAANEILSQMLVQTQQPRDLSQYANNYLSRYGLAVNLEPSFQKDAGPVYDREQKVLPAFMASSAFAPAVADLHSVDPKVRERAIRTLDTKYGIGFHRYFTGGQ